MTKITMLEANNPINHAAESSFTPEEKERKTDRVVSALQPTWLIGLGRARTRDEPVSRRKGYPDRFRGSPPRSSVDALPDFIVLFLPCQVVGDVTPTPCAPPSKGRPLAPAEAYPAARGVRRQGHAMKMIVRHEFHCTATS